MNFTSPLAQLFSPIVPDTPDGGFHGQNGSQQGGFGANLLGQRRGARRSANDGQLAPGVAMFRRRAMAGMASGLGASALSVTPGEGPSKEPSETAGEMEDDEDRGAPMPTKMAVMEQRLQRIEDMLQQLMDRLDG